MEYFEELLAILNAMSPYLLLGFFIAGLLHVYVPRTTFSRYLSKKGFRSVFLSAIFGVPLPLCSCGVIPTAMSLRKEGASNGATVSFLIATPQTGIDSILATYGLLGLPFAIIRPIVAFIVALCGGMLVDRFSPSGGAPYSKSSECHPTKAPRLGMVDALRYGFIEMLQDLGGWLAIGLVIAGAITAFVPASFFDLLGEYYFLNLGVVLLLSVPMYICSTGSIPIAVSLLMMGVSPGAALVFLMAGPATNVATLTVLRKVLGVRTTFLYLLSIILGAFGFAVIIDFVLPSEWFVCSVSAVGDSVHCQGGAAWWEVASSIVFVVLLAAAYIVKFTGGSHHTHSHEEVEDSEVALHRYKVEGMRCNHCKANIEKAIESLSDALEVSADLSSGIVEVRGDIAPVEVCSSVSALGFSIVQVS